MKSLFIFPTILLLVFTFSFQSASAANFTFAFSDVRAKRPCQNAQVEYTARVKRNGKSLKGVNVKLKVHYKSKITTYRTAKSNNLGRVSKKFKIGMATPNYRVKIKSEAKSNNNIFRSTTTKKQKKCS